MGAPGQPASIFSQKLDRVAFISYFLGAVVPLVALGFVVESYALPTLTDRYAILGLVGLVVSIAVLSLASFLTLRVTTRRSLRRIDRDHRRLGTLLEVSSSLAGMQYGGEAADAAARSALSLTGDPASFVLVRGEPGAPPVRLAAAGRNATQLEKELVEPLLEVTLLVLSGGRPALAGATGSSAALAAVPLPGEAVTQGALVTVGRAGKQVFDASEVDALATLGGLAAVALRNADLRDTQRNFFAHVTDLLVSALDTHPGYHSGHSARVARYANRIARQMGFDR
jgi:K+-sensing histidine kinase KdpD